MNHWIARSKPLAASLLLTASVHARIELLYQGTSWEYIQFLNLANKQQNEFLGQEGINMLDAGLNSNW